MSEHIHISYYPSPVGLLKIKFTINTVRRIDFVDNEYIGSDYCNHYNNKKARQIHNTIYDQFNEYFTGYRTEFNLPINAEGTSFQIEVWQELQKIPYGEAKSYGEIAARINRKGAARAVGAAAHKNPLAIVIPCHRVVGKNGQLVGYAGGIQRKKWLLNHEKKIITQVY